MNTEMKKQRAVDYFYSQLTVIPFVEKMKMTGIFITLEKYHDILEKAKAMEKEQIMEAFYNGTLCDEGFGSDYAEEYYNQEYESEE